LRSLIENSSFICSSCGNEQIGLPLSFAADFPDPFANLGREERETRAVTSSDQCIIDGEEFYIRGLIQLPVRDSEDVFLWGVWARVNESAFDTISDHWESPGRELRIGPFKGRLANSLSLYLETLNMRLEIKIQHIGERPLFIVEELDHLLCADQNNGLTVRKAQESACLLMRMAR
jgi:hypothetical protein